MSQMSVSWDWLCHLPGNFQQGSEVRRTLNHIHTERHDSHTCNQRCKDIYDGISLSHQSWFPSAPPKWIPDYCPLRSPTLYYVIQGVFTIGVWQGIPFTSVVWQRISLLLGSDRRFLYYWGLTKDSFTIGVWQRIPLLLGSDKGFLYYWGPTEDSFTIGVWQSIPLLLGSDKGFLYYWGPTKDSFTIGVWQRIPLLLGSDKGFLYYWGPTEDSFTIKVWGRLNLAPGRFINHWAAPADLQTHFKQTKQNHRNTTKFPT